MQGLGCVMRRLLFDNGLGACNQFLGRIHGRFESGQPGASNFVTLVVLDIEQCLCRLHDRCRRIPEAEISQLFGIVVKALRVNDSIAALPIVVAAEPDRDVLRIGDFVAHELVTRHL
jgi:hypothetical protein